MSEVVWGEALLEAKPQPVRSAQVIEAPKATVWRVQQSELETLAWLPQRFRETGYPGLNETGLLSLMYTAMVDRNYLLIRADRCVGLYRCETTCLEPRTTVIEQWIRMRTPFVPYTESFGPTMGEERRQQMLASNAEVLQMNEIRLFAIDWARQIKACRFIFELDSDLPPDTKGAAGRINVGDYRKGRRGTVDLTPAAG